MPNIDDIIDTWKAEHNGRIPVKSASRIPALRDLILSLEVNGFKKEDLTTSIKIKIIEACVWMGHPNGTKLRRWKDAVMADLRIAIAQIWPEKTVTATDEDIKVRQADPTRVDTVPEVQAEEEEYKRIGEELDRSIFNNEPNPQVIWDEEFAKELGLDTDE